MDQILKYQDKIKRFFKKNQLSFQDIEDLTQESLCRIFESIHNFKNRSSLNTWVYSICKYVLFDFFKRKKKMIYHLEEQYISVAENSDSISNQFDIEKLPAYLRVIYKKKYRQNMKIWEISKEMSIPQGTVKYYLYKIRNILKNQL